VDATAASDDSRRTSDVAEAEPTDVRPVALDLASADTARVDSVPGDVAPPRDGPPLVGPVLTPVLRPARALLFGEAFEDHRAVGVDGFRFSAARFQGG